MKRLALVVAGSLGIVLVGAVFLRGQPAPAENSPSKGKRTITAFGSATVTGKLDMGRVYLSVVTSEKTVDAARVENARVVSKVRDAILALKLADLKTRTTDTRVSIHHQRDEPYKITGYEVGHSFTMLVKESDPEKLGIAAGRILDAGLKNGVNRDGSIEFFKENDADMRRQAMSEAVEDALANAKAHAAGANVKVLDVVEIDGSLERFEPSGFGSQLGGGRYNETSISVSAGAWNVSRRVRIVCRY
jgi:uncharacterized protein YggE